MDVAFLRIRIDGELNKTLAEIVGHLERSYLDANKKAHTINHDILDVPDARRWRKGPLRHALCFTECLKLAPRRTFVLADIKMGGQGASEYNVAAVQTAGAR